MVYRCNECGHLFENGEEKLWKEPHGETNKGCPLCGGMYEEMFDCQICGNHTKSDDDLCDECKKDVIKLFKKLLDDNFGEPARNYINELLEIGEEIWK